MQIANLVQDGLLRSLGWLDANRDSFSLNLAEHGIDRLLLLKPLSELVLTLRILHREAHDVREHLDWCWSQVCNGSYLVDLLVVRPDMADLSSLYANFVECGYSNERLIEALAYIKSLNSTNAFEMPLWSRIGREYNFYRLGIAAPPIAFTQASWIASTPEPWTISDASAYAVTHEVFYGTDFGRSLNVIDHQQSTFLELWLPVWLQCFADEQNWDLVGELLMVARFLKHSYNVTPILRMFLGAQAEDGSFPPPCGAGRMLIGNANSVRRTFLSHYHTALVGLMTTCIYNTHIEDARRPYTPAPHVESNIEIN